MLYWRTVIIIDFGVVMLKYLQKTLNLRYTSSLGIPYLICLLEELNHLDYEERCSFLKMLGSYTATYPYPTDELDTLYKLIGPLPNTCLSFAESIFDFDIEEYNCIKIGKKLEHKLFADIRPELKSAIYTRLITNNSIPKFFEPYVVEALIPGNFETYSVINQSIFVTLLKSSIRREQLKDQSLGGALAAQLQEQINKLKLQYNYPLLPIEIDKRDLELIKVITASLITGAIRNNDMHDFISKLGEGGLLFISCLLFAREHEKESNRDFWKEYFHWLKIDHSPYIKISQNKIYEQIRQFWEANNIIHIYSKNRNIQYVLTFRMHSIVANRPLSKHLITRFLIKIINSNGTIFHDNDDQKKLLVDSLTEYALPIIEEDSDENPVNAFLQLPRETAQAFYYSFDQVVHFIAPVYDYMERRLVDITNDNQTSYSREIEFPQFLELSVEEALQETSVEEIKSVRKILGNQLRGPVTIALDTFKKQFHYLVPVYSFIDLSEHLSITFSLIDSDEVIFQKKHLEYDSIGSAVYTKQFAIPCDKYRSTLVFQFSNEEKVLAKGKVVLGVIFNADGDLIHFPCKTEQPVYCVAKEDSIDADNLERVRLNILEDFSLWETYLSEDCPILINNILYSLGSNHNKQRAGLIYKRDVYRQTHFSSDKTLYPIIGEYPEIFLRHHSSIPIKNEFTFILDGIEIPFTVVSSHLLEDGTGESYYRFKIDSSVMLPSAKLVHFRLFSSADHTDYISETWFCLKNLQIQYSRALYYGTKNAEIVYLSFDGKDVLFQSHNYFFPNSLLKYKIDLDNEKDNRLILTPPMITVTAGGESLFQKELWYEDLVEHGGIAVSAPTEVTNLSLITVDSNNHVTHRLKRRGEIYNAEYLSQLPETEEDFVTLYLQGHIHKEKVVKPICKIYYRVTKKQEKKEVFFFMSQSDNFRFSKVKPGLVVHLSYFCSRNKDYDLRIRKKDQPPIIISGKLNTEGDFSHYQKENIEKGTYLITVYETRVNTITGKSTERKVCSNEIIYNSGKSVEPRDDITGFISPSNYLADMQWHTIQLLFSVKRTFKGNDCIYTPHTVLRSFFIETDCKLSVGESFSSRGFFYDRYGKRIDLDHGKLFSVTVKKKQRDGKMVLLIRDRNHKPLRVGAQSGFVNPISTSRFEHEYECIFFLGQTVYLERSEG